MENPGEGNSGAAYNRNIQADQKITQKTVAYNI